MIVHVAQKHQNIFITTNLCGDIFRKKYYFLKCSVFKSADRVSVLYFCFGTAFILTLHCVNAGVCFDWIKKWPLSQLQSVSLV